MATNLFGPVCIGELNACIVRAASLGADCRPNGGANSGIVTAALVTMTADPEIETPTVFEPKNGCGDIMYTVRPRPRVKGYNLSGTFVFFDYEMMALMFGGQVLLGAAGGWAAGKVAGYAEPLFSTPIPTAIYLEIIRQVATPDGGECIQEGAAAGPAASGHVFGKVKLVHGSHTFENDVATVAFTGYADANNYLFNGPWNDWPMAGYIPNSPHVEALYSQAQYDAIADVVGCGYQADLPAGS